VKPKTARYFLRAAIGLFYDMQQGGLPQHEVDLIKQSVGVTLFESDARIGAWLSLPVLISEDDLFDYFEGTGRHISPFLDRSRTHSDRNEFRCASSQSRTRTSRRSTRSSLRSIARTNVDSKDRTSAQHYIISRLCRPTPLFKNLLESESLESILDKHSTTLGLYRRSSFGLSDSDRSLEGVRAGSR